MLHLTRAGSVSVGVTVALALEFEAVCMRDEYVQGAGLQRANLQNFVNAVIAIARPVPSRSISGVDLNCVTLQTRWRWKQQ